MTDVYVLHEGGITCLDYDTCMQYMAKRFDLKDAEQAHKLTSAHGWVLMPPDTISYKPGDLISHKHGEVYKLNRHWKIPRKELCLISPAYWQGQVIPLYLKNEKELD